MRYGIFSDVHANLDAFQTVLDAYRDEKIDKYIYLGDIVGYGAEPSACIKKLQSLDAIILAGNHDRACADKAALEYFNQHAKEAVSWTCANLSKEELDFLNNLPLVKVINNMTLTHGSLNEPERFNYIQDIYTAGLSFERMDNNLCFIGHSHIPVVFTAEENYIRYNFDEVTDIAPEVKYIINVGSVGQPRDGDPRAAYAIYDTETNKVEIKRISYDIQAQQKKIIAAGLPVKLAERLERGR